MTRLALGCVVTGLLLVTGCNPYVAAISAVSESYDVAEDPRSLKVQASDTEVEAKIEAALVASPEPGTDGLDVFCRRGVVLLAGVVPPGSRAGRAAVDIARTTPGVRRVETFFVSARPSRVGDLEVATKIKAAFVADTRISEPEVKVAVYGGHVVLVGVVSDWAAADAFVQDARGVDGVISVRSYIQVV